jgi:DNA-binding transcriptional regulator YhcF (GntR family)
MVLDKQHPTPVYLQLKEMLQSQIEQGVYLSHQKLPSERDLCQHHNLSRMTARRALQELIAEGFAYTRPGKGTFVGDRPNSSGNTVSNQATFHWTSDLVDNVPSVHYRQKLVPSLLSFDCVGVERAISEALAVYSLETVAGELFPKIIQYSERQWQKGEVSLLVHNYVVNTLCSHLIAMVNAATMAETGPKVLLACAPDDQHEIGLLLMALSLRRRGFQVVYLGPTVAVDEFYQVIDTTRPQLVCFSAATSQSVTNLIKLGHQCSTRLSTTTNDQKPNPRRTLLTFGGVAFNQNPAFISSTPGLYLGNTVDSAVTKIQELLAA